MTIQQLQEAAPSWANWLVIAGGAALSWIQPVAGVVAIVWGGMQAYSWIVNKGWRKRTGR